MIKKRIIVCLDVRDGKLTKGIKFQNNISIGDPVERAEFYYEAGADELVFYDITASYENRNIMTKVVERVAKKIYIPFSVGGGVKTIRDMDTLLQVGAEKISINSLAVLDPSVIEEGAKKFGKQCMVLAIDALADSTMPSGYTVVIHGGRTKTGKDVLAWAKEAQERGAGELVLNSIDADGTKKGYECTLTKMVSTELTIPVIASGGAGNPQHLEEVLTVGCADAALIASMVHYGNYSISNIKKYLHNKNIPVRH